ncbi:MAG TPA: amidohydrolase family protein [Trebonia sp.]|nr:amidohydrolase family protein [Trebonia sp.]
MSSLLLRRVRVVPLDPGPASARPASAGPAGAGPAGTGPASTGLSDVLIEGGVITRVRPAGITPASTVARPAGVREVAADGRWLIPGLWDAHVHLGQWALASRRLDLSRTSSPEQVLALVARAAREGQPVVGTGQRAGTWGRQVTVTELDAVSGDLPVVLVNADFHHAWLNTAALDRLGLARRNVVVAEAEWFAAYPRVAGFECPASAGDYQRVLRDAAARGVAGLVDFEFGAPWTDWARRWHEGCDSLRIRWSPYDGQLDSVRAAGLRTGAALPGAGADGGTDGRLTVGSLKIISDGSLGTRTAWCRQPYADTGGFGAPSQPADELAAVIAEGRRLGLSVATHAIGDQALETALAAYAATGAGGSIEHAQLTTGRALADLARLGLVASVQPAHLLDDHPTMDRVWGDRTERCFTLRSMLQAGVEVRLGSDAPVAPLDPWLAIATAVHRGQPGDESWHPEQAITPTEAIVACVDGRRIAVGQPGDVALLDADPLAVGPAGLRSMRVALTAVAGRVVHEACSG